MSLTHLHSLRLSVLHLTLLLPLPWSIQPTALRPTFSVKSHLPFKFLAAILSKYTPVHPPVNITDLSFCTFFQPFLLHSPLPLFTPITVYPFTTTLFLRFFRIQLIRGRVTLPPLPQHLTPTTHPSGSPARPYFSRLRRLLELKL